MVSVARDLREAWRRTYAGAGRKPERRVEQSEGSGLTLMRMNVLVLRRACRCSRCSSVMWWIVRMLMMIEFAPVGRNMMEAF